MLIDRANLSEMLTQLAADSEPAPLDIDRAFWLFLSLLLVGSGRAARGETMSGHVFIKQYALSHLLSVIIEVVPFEQEASLDNLDPFRRVEHAFPKLAQEIHNALLLEPMESAQALLQIAETHILSVWMPEKPAAVSVIKTYIEDAAKFAQTGQSS